MKKERMREGIIVDGGMDGVCGNSSFGKDWFFKKMMEWIFMGIQCIERWRKNIWGGGK